MLIQKFEKEDFNRDGYLNIDGWNAALFISEVKVTMDNEEIEECFHLLEENDKTVAYA